MKKLQICAKKSMNNKLNNESLLHIIASPK